MNNKILFHFHKNRKYLISYLFFIIYLINFFNYMHAIKTENLEKKKYMKINKN